MQAYELTRLISERETSSKPYLEFLKVSDLSMGLYVLPAGGRDPQSPHTEDEVYYVVSGRAESLWRMRTTMCRQAPSCMWQKMWPIISILSRRI